MLSPFDGEEVKRFIIATMYVHTVVHKAMSFNMRKWIVFFSTQHYRLGTILYILY